MAIPLPNTSPIALQIKSVFGCTPRWESYTDIYADGVAERTDW
jgi:hypothetical protein